MARFRIEAGTYADYAALARFHYRAGRPAIIAGILRCRAGRTLAGVLVAAHPTLHSSWRGRVWPDLDVRRFGGQRAHARAVNREVRTIARVVVDPRYRGLGVGVRLVRAYLRRAPTPRVEALAAMGQVSGFFVRAGMRMVEVPRTEATVQLARELRGRGVAAWRLLDRDWTRRRLARDAGLREVLRAWRRDTRAVRTKRARWTTVAAHAAAALTVGLRAYVWERQANVRARRLRHHFSKEMTGRIIMPARVARPTSVKLRGAEPKTRLSGAR